MEHTEYWPLIDARADGQLGPEENARLDAHLQGCANCASRLDLAMREVDSLRSALVAADPPRDLVLQVMAAIERREERRARSIKYAVWAGVLGNLITATALLLLSLGTKTSLIVMLLVAVAGAVVWGSVKGLAFGWGMRYLPGGVLPRGLLFGLATWAVTNLLLGLVGGFGSSMEYALPFVLLGSLLHHLVYGALISWLYDRFTTPSRLAAPA